tara:strand:+ start:922 stop:1071 length:150 start_codon:yes stop_codon:yes gene_type:complete
MITQADTLRAEIKTLEAQLQHAALNRDAFSQIAIHKRLDIAKSILINIY